MSTIHQGVQRLIQNALLLPTDAEHECVIVETLNFLNTYTEAVINKDFAKLTDFKNNQDIIVQSVVFYHVLQMVYQRPFPQEYKVIR